MRDPRLLGPDKEQEPNQAPPRFFVLGNQGITADQFSFVKASYTKFRTDVIAGVVPQQASRVVAPDGGELRMHSRFGHDYLFYVPPPPQGEPPIEPTYPTATFYCMPFDEFYDETPDLTPVYEADWTTSGNQRVGFIDESARVAFPPNEPTPLSAHPGNTTWFAPPPHPNEGIVISWWGQTPNRYGVEPAGQVARVLYTQYPNEFVFDASYDYFNLPYNEQQNLLKKYPPGTWEGQFRPSAMVFGAPTPCVWINGRLVVLEWDVTSACLATRDVEINGSPQQGMRVLRVWSGADVVDFLFSDIEATANSLDPLFTGVEGENYWLVTGDVPNIYNFGTHPAYWNADGDKAVWIDQGATNAEAYEATVDSSGAMTYAAFWSAVMTVTELNRNLGNRVVQEGPDWAAANPANIFLNESEPTYGPFEDTQTHEAHGFVDVEAAYSRPLCADYRGNERVLFTFSAYWNAHFYSDSSGINNAHAEASSTYLAPYGAQLTYTSLKTTDGTSSFVSGHVVTSNFRLQRNGVDVLLDEVVETATLSLTTSYTWEQTVDTANLNQIGPPPWSYSDDRADHSFFNYVNSHDVSTTGSGFLPVLAGGDIRGDALYVHLETRPQSPSFLINGRRYFNRLTGVSRWTATVGVEEQNTSHAEAMWTGTAGSGGLLGTESGDTSGFGRANQYSLTHEFERNCGALVGQVLEINPANGAYTTVGRSLPPLAVYDYRKEEVPNVGILPYPLFSDYATSFLKVWTEVDGFPVATTNNSSSTGTYNYPYGAKPGPTRVDYASQFGYGGSYAPVEIGVPLWHYGYTITAFDYEVPRRFGTSAATGSWTENSPKNFMVPFPHYWEVQYIIFDTNTWPPPTNPPYAPATPAQMADPWRPEITTISSALSPDNALYYVSFAMPANYDSTPSGIIAPLVVNKWFIDGFESVLDIGYKADPADPQFPEYANPIFVGPIP